MKKYFFFNTEPNTNILGLDPIIRAFWSKEMLNFTGGRLSVFVYELDQGTFQAGCLKKEWLDFSDQLFQRFLDDHSFPTAIVESLTANGEKLFSYCQDIRHRQDTGMSLTEQKKAILKIFDLFTAICVPGLVAPIIEFGSGGMTKKIYEIIAAKDLSNSGLSAPEALAILATSPKKIWTDEAREALLELAVAQAAKYPDIPTDILSTYVEKWGWVYYGYCGPEYTVASVRQELASLITDSTDIADKLFTLRQEKAELVRRQAKLQEELHFTEEEKYILAAAQDFAYTKAYRANLMALADHTVNKLLWPIAQQGGYSIKQLGMCTVREMKKHLQVNEPLPSVDVLNQRLRYCLFLSEEKGESVLIGAEAKKWVEDNIEQEKVPEGLQELGGMVACAGGIKKVGGRARIVLTAADVEKVREGEILLSTTTIPDFVPAMRRAVAVVTETGGLTCHAAIVSREMNKPCLIGVKHLLKIFKDGDQVEVDIRQGTIRKIT
ncbi:MAG TPA: PEP-utilizing enzyme [Patescibacteria group bacterium]|nr:PEP-utilizing enzyme [Patescibacteria group bacterium]